jgi:hypothetical protein
VVMQAKVLVGNESPGIVASLTKSILRALFAAHGAQVDP